MRSPEHFFWLVAWVLSFKNLCTWAQYAGPKPRGPLLPPEETGPSMHNHEPQLSLHSQSEIRKNPRRKLPEEQMPETHSRSLFSIKQGRLNMLISLHANDCLLLKNQLTFYLLLICSLNPQNSMHACIL